MTVSSQPPPTRMWLEGLPKVELHCHLDGSLRPATVLELAAQQDVDLAAKTEAELLRLVQAGEVRTDLESYLVAFETTLSVLQTEAALERVAFELVVDAFQENVAGLEIRFSPLLCQRKGLSLDAVVNAVSSGVKRATAVTHTHAGLILCGIRTLSPESSVQVVECARRFMGKGVVGVDLAGPEKGFPAGDHQRAFDLAHAAGLGITVHAGEAEGAWSVREAVLTQHATRIGHGTHAIEDDAVVQLLIDRAVTLEVCLKSNVETQSVAHVSEHPLAQLLGRGVRACLNTDNRLMSNERLTDELELGCNAFALTRDQVRLLTQYGIEASFLGRAAQNDLSKRLASYL